MDYGCVNFGCLVGTLLQINQSDLYFSWALLIASMRRRRMKLCTRVWMMLLLLHTSMKCRTWFDKAVMPTFMSYSTRNNIPMLLPLLSSSTNCFHITIVVALTQRLPHKDCQYGSLFASTREPNDLLRVCYMHRRQPQEQLWLTSFKVKGGRCNAFYWC